MWLQTSVCWDEDDTETFIAELVTRRRDELDGGPR
ncbi:hypothetical protein ABIA19_005836 [Sinorhizobium fredii]